jgi:hypothetical protein
VRIATECVERFRVDPLVAHRDTEHRADGRLVRDLGPKSGEQRIVGWIGGLRLHF